MADPPAGMEAKVLTMGVGLTWVASMAVQSPG